MLLLDTYNITHTTGILPPELAGIDVAELAQLIRLSRYRAEETMLVCDGDKHDEVEAGREGLITIRFAGKGKSADDLIAHLIDKSTTPRRLLVVSSDHEILKVARRRKCKTLTSPEFLQHLVNDVKPQLSPNHRVKKTKPGTAKPSSASMTASQVDRWVDLFKVDEAALAAHADKAIEAMELESERAKTQATELKSPEKPVEKTPAPVAKPIAPKPKDPDKARHRVSTINVNIDAPTPSAVIPDDLIAQAEQMLNNIHSSDPPTRRKRT